MIPMDWNKEVENMSKGGSDFLKLSAGQHKVKFLDEGEDKELQWEDKTILKRNFRVSFNGEEHTWSVTKGTTLNSLYGQISLVARQKGGLIGAEVTVIVKGSGKETSYTILEALQLQQEEQNNRKEVNVEKIGG